MSQMEPPTGFRKVSQNDFFAALYADPRDIMPVITHSPNYTLWETKSRVVWGWSSGWKKPWNEPDVWAIRT